MLYPMFAMVLLTFCVGILAAQARFSSVKKKQVNPAYFKLMQEEHAGNIPERVAVTTRSVNNMFEVPVLFYIGAVMAVSLGVETGLTLVTAWLFVFSRYLHAWIHLTYNHVIHRMLAFWFGLMCALALWVELLFLA